MSDMTARRGKVTDVHREEARRLKAIWDATYTSRKATGLHSQEAFGERFHIGNQAAVGFFLNGKTALSLKAARGFAEGLGCNISDFSPRLAEEAAKNAEFAPAAEDDFADVRRIDVKVSAGHGTVPHLEEELGSLKFRRDFLQAVGVSEANAVVMQVQGASMEPTIADGAVLLVNRANREPRANAIYVFHLEGNGLMVKRVVKSGERWLARSDNDDRQAFPDFPFDEGATLIGRAVWMGVKL